VCERERERGSAIVEREREREYVCVYLWGFVRARAGVCVHAGGWAGKCARERERKSKGAREGRA